MNETGNMVNVGMEILRAFFSPSFEDFRNIRGVVRVLFSLWHCVYRWPAGFVKLSSQERTAKRWFITVVFFTHSIPHTNTSPTTTTTIISTDHSTHHALSSKTKATTATSTPYPDDGTIAQRQNGGNLSRGSGVKHAFHCCVSCHFARFLCVQGPTCNS